MTGQDYQTLRSHIFTKHDKVPASVDKRSKQSGTLGGLKYPVLKTCCHEGENNNGDDRNGNSDQEERRVITKHSRHDLPPIRACRNHHSPANGSGTLGRSLVVGRLGRNRRLPPAQSD